MDTRRLIALLFIAIGVVALLARLSGGTGWLWLAVVAVAFLVAYGRERTRGLLVIGSVLAGISVGMLLEGNLGWDGGFLVGLGAGILGIDLFDPAPRRWPRIVGAAVIVIGLINGVLQAGIVGSTWFALVLIGAGIWLALRKRPGGWVVVGPPPDSEARFEHAPQPPPTDTPAAAQPSDPPQVDDDQT